MVDSIAKLPADLLNRAVYGRPGREYAWPVDDIPDLIEAARRASLMSLGGTLQFCLPGGGTCECYWVSIEPRNVPDGIDWQANVNWSAESCRRCYDDVITQMDLVRVGRDEFGGPLRQLSDAGTDIAKLAVFTWSVCDAGEYAELQRQRMAAARLEAQVILLVAEAADVKPEKVHWKTRLLDDLGLDGDDAFEFFNRVHERFGTDLTNLHRRWRKHFGREGLSCAAGLIFIPAAVIGGVVGSGAGPIAGTVTAIALVAASIWTISHLRLVEPSTPITVGEVVSAVEAGSWPAHENEV